MLCLCSACIDPSSFTVGSSWYGRLESSGWLSHVESLLKTVKHVVHTIHHDGKYTVIMCIITAL